MNPEEKGAKWGEIGVAPDLFYFYRGYPIKASFDYNNEVSYIAVIPTKETIAFKTSKESFEEDAKTAINNYLKENQPEKISYIALISEGMKFAGSLPDFSETLINADSLDDIRYELTSYGQLELKDFKEHPKPSLLNTLLERSLYPKNNIPLLITLDK